MNLQNRSLELQPVPECYILVLDKEDAVLRCSLKISRYPASHCPILLGSIAE